MIISSLNIPINEENCELVFMMLQDVICVILLAGVYLQQEDSGFFMALCMVFMMLQDVICVIILI